MLEGMSGYSEGDGERSGEGIVRGMVMGMMRGMVRGMVRGLFISGWNWSPLYSFLSSHKTLPERERSPPHVTPQFLITVQYIYIVFSS